MSSEPRICLKSLTGRIQLEDYARAVQMVDAMKDENGNPMYRDMSALVRDAIHKHVSCVELDAQHTEWVEVQRQENIEKRAKKRGRRRSFLSRVLFK